MSAPPRRKLLYRIIKLAVRLVMLVLLCLCGVMLLPQYAPPGWQPAAELPVEPLPALSPTDRVLVLCPHPDDDVICCAGVILKATSLHIPIHVLYLTNGDANEWSFVTYGHRVPMRPRAVLHMGDVRHAEAMSGEAVMGVNPGDLTFLGYPDHGCEDIFTSHWGAGPPYRALFTRATAVPYPYAMSPNAPYRGESILADLSRVIAGFRPTQIFVSHPVDRNVDHRALYLYMRVALWHLDPASPPAVHPFLTHTPGWPRPEGLHTDQEIPVPTIFRGHIAWTDEPLTRVEEAEKESAIGTHQTQMSYSASYLLSFMRKNELFGDLLPVDLGASDASPSASREGRSLGVENAPIVGREWRFARMANGRLDYSLVYAKPVAGQTRALFHFFGDRADRPFAQMPKITILVDPFGIKVLDGTRRLNPGSVTIERSARQMRVSVPLSLLGDPRHVLVSATSYLAEIELDYEWWGILEMPR